MSRTGRGLAWRLAVLTSKCNTICSRPVPAKNDKGLPPSLQQALLQQALEKAAKNKEAGVTEKQAESYAYDGKKNIFTPLKFAFNTHTFLLELPSRNGGNGGSRGVFEVSRQRRLTVCLS